MIGGGPFDFSQPSLVIAIEFQTKFDACEHVSLLEYGHVPHGENGSDCEDAGKVQLNVNCCCQSQT